MFSFQPTDRVFSEALYIFPFATHDALALLQSRIHEAWTRLLSSSMRTHLNYAASDCFDTFPFPEDMGALEDIGSQLDKARRSYMVSNQVGLTVTYNAMKDAEVHEPAIVELRRLSEALDRAVLSAYGWDDIVVPDYREPFPEEVLDRLFWLNLERFKKQ